MELAVPLLKGSSWLRKRASRVRNPAYEDFPTGTSYKTTSFKRRFGVV
jgi:hypothetical protein